MSFVHDSYRSRDYRKGTRSRVFLTKNSGCCMHGSRARVVVCSQCTPPTEAGGPQLLIWTPGASGPCDGCRWILPLPDDGYLSPSSGHCSFAWKLNPRKPPPLHGICATTVAFGHFERQCRAPRCLALPPCLGSPSTGSLPPPHLHIRGVTLRLPRTLLTCSPYLRTRSPLPPQPWLSTSGSVRGTGPTWTCTTSKGSSTAGS
jgi:hypothetical protein